MVALRAEFAQWRRDGGWRTAGGGRPGKGGGTRMFFFTVMGD